MSWAAARLLSSMATSVASRGCSASPSEYLSTAWDNEFGSEDRSASLPLLFCRSARSSGVVRRDSSAERKPSSSNGLAASASPPASPLAHAPTV
eukprot:scaffold16571_cov122-Isochrysis_galbana.AAC.9